jgi:glycosyltransferase involved in cell wall biosynthesis
MNIKFADIGDFVEKIYGVYDRPVIKNKKEYQKEAPSGFVEGAFVYAQRIQKIAVLSDADIVHAHDWITFPAGLQAKKITGKPLVVHIHSTEHDRSGGNYPNQSVFNIEKHGLKGADRIISVSDYTKGLITKNYGLDPDKIEVVHNGVDEITKKDLPPALGELKNLGYKVVLYLGRISLHKGPDYFVRAAKKVNDYDNKTIFVVAGSGEMQEQMIAEAAKLNVLDKFMFTGFIRGDEKDRIYQAADVYVLPSVSEPFGITPLEAVANGTPAVISKQSGVSEVLEHALKTDFWDVDDMANKILAALKYPVLKRDLVLESGKELRNINWDQAASKCINVYNGVVAR